jgi:RNA polymerase sigma factor (sigma-70 family)
MAFETVGAALRHLNRLLAGGVIAGLSDGQLLERFLSQGDAAAFEALVGRHGPMVLSVCRGILRDSQDAEDAFQATFLVLVKNGGAIRGRDALAGWLHQVAHRVAIQANLTAARRRRLERQVGQMAVAARAKGAPSLDDLLPALHEEIARLPEKYRLAVVHCDLEGMTQAQAAGQLHWSRRTLQNRLAEGRARLKRRLARRGLAPDGAALTALFLREARAAVPSAWCEATVRAALATMNPTVTLAVVSAAAQQLAQEVFKVMLLRKLTLASITLLSAGLIAWGASAALVSLAQETPRRAAAPTTPAGRSKADVTVPDRDPGPLETVGTFRVRGRVLDPDGKPLAGAAVYVRHHAEIRWNLIDPMATRQKGRVAVADADGRFHFELDKGAGDIPSSGDIPWHKAQIAAAAPGFALAWVEAGDLLKTGEATLRLVRDDMPIHGRILDSQGQPVAGVLVRIQMIWEVKQGLDLDAILAWGELDWEKLARWYGLHQRAPVWHADSAPLWPGGANAWTTDADGRFEARGVGRDRIARLEFHGGGVADGTIDVMARPAKTPPKAHPHPSISRDVMLLGRQAAFIGIYPQATQLVGTTFEYIAGPAKPIAGVVRLKGSGKPVEGAVVWAADAATHTSVTARTDAAGRFRIEGVPKGDFYQIRLNPRPGIDTFLGHSEIIDDTEGTKPIELAIEVPLGVIVIGRLVDTATGQVVPPTEVRYMKRPNNSSSAQAALGFSDLADSKFGLTVPPGPALIFATVRGKEELYVGARLKALDRGKGIDDSSPGFGAWQHSHAYRFIDPPADARSLEAELELTRTEPRKGSLVGPSGKPVSGARVYGQVSMWGYVRTLPDDTFEVYGLEAGRPRLVIFAHKDSQLVGSVLLKDDALKSKAPLVVRLERAGSVKGRLVDEDGQPLAGARLETTTYDAEGINLPIRKRGFPAFGELWPDDETFTADSNGRFQVDGLKRDVKTTISVSSSNPNVRLTAGAVLRNLTVEPGQVRDLGNVTVTETAE